MIVMTMFLVDITIENKPTIRDPEGEVIEKDLVVRNGYQQIRGVRTAKLLKLKLEAENETAAKEITAKMCDDLRIYNPLVSMCSISVRVSD